MNSSTVVSGVADPVSLVSGLMVRGFEGAVAAGLCLAYYGSVGSVTVTEAVVKGLVGSDAGVEAAFEVLKGKCEVVGDGCDVRKVLAGVAAGAAAGREAAKEVGAGVAATAARGKNYWVNKRKRARKERQKGQSASGREVAAVVAKTALQESLEAKWAAENEVARLEAEQRLVLLRARDMDVAKRRQHAKMVRDAEVSKVQTEKAFGYLARTGNVPGFAETVVTGSGSAGGSAARSDGSGISPDSSVSQQEIRQMQKDLVDAAAREKEASDREMRMRMVIERFKVLCPGEDPGVFSYEKPRTATTSYTLDSKGKFVGNPPDPLFGYVGEDGRFHVDDDGY